MSVYHGVDGQLLNASLEFLDDNDQPLVPKQGYPVCKLLNAQKSVISSVMCSPSSTPGTWLAGISVPEMKLSEKQEFTLVWRMTTQDGEKYKNTDSVILEPKNDVRESDVVATFGDQYFSFMLPVSFGTGWTGTYQIFTNNLPNVASTDTALEGNTAITIEPGIDKTLFTCPLAIPKANLFANVLKLDVKPAGARPRTFLYKLWAVTPQILLGMSNLDSFLNKSRVENVIPELRYTDGDLIHYLERGLYLFNTVAQPTYFDGTNMQGILFDAWINCSCYYALGAQILAEGSLSFDFSGQGISLNVDRTPQLDAALGRIESYISERVVPLKKQLFKSGTTTGDGSQGRTGIDNPSNVGVLNMINAPTTRLPRFSQMFVGRRG